ncbi:hypothetical protein BCR44DRAFT_1430460 [Catenaria anguillulae PL171]|uniref:Transmembrane protein n=1 Tax=Catenaria anguillulae PL171 TaxID=765915 RepID=A0A1Y2HSJ8_9FUNG|nr:hypothetical protein BCR44DRAFT_1430460 [Catenaria anguillulae PL171]
MANLHPSNLTQIKPLFVVILALATPTLANVPRPALGVPARLWPAPDRLDGCVFIEDGTQQQKPWWTRDCKPEIVSWAVAITVLGGLALVCGCLSCCCHVYVANLITKKLAERTAAGQNNRDVERAEVAVTTSSDKLTS